MSVKKMGSKLAQGVRQVMEQGNKSESVEKEVSPRVTAPVVSAKNAGKPDRLTVKDKTPARSSSTGYEVLHPERVWPD